MRMMLIAAIILIAVGLAWFVNRQIEAGKVTEVKEIVQTQVVREETRNVLIAKKTLSVGTLINPEDIEQQRFPQTSVRPEYLTDETTPDLTSLAGTVVRLEIAAGEPLITGKIVRPGERGYLAAVLRPGMKAVAISVNGRTGVAGFVFPGDRVDVLLSQSLSESNGGSATATATTRQITETLIKNVRVLGVGQTLGRPETPTIAGDTMTLELTPKLAEIVTLANELGRLSVVLNPLAKLPADQTPEALAAAEIAEESYPYMVEGVADGTAYSITNEVEASPARSGSGGSGSISIFRAEGGRGSGSAQLREGNVNVFRPNGGAGSGNVPTDRGGTVGTPPGNTDNNSNSAR
ncbi:MAG: Flp pilus assembly protein CpaB [Alphaproteobacteria bacterium]|jgi:pilus assembly protein CpaB|nr:Flp pilus assembly protein CpaB [Alphaproteobacteria bacterium]